MLKFSEILILTCRKFYSVFYLILHMKFFPIAVVSPLCILGFNFHTLWLQFLFHQKFPLLSYDLKRCYTVSLNDKDVYKEFAPNKFLENTFQKFRSSHSQLFFKIGALKNFAILTGKHLCWSLVLIKLPA